MHDCWPSPPASSCQRPLLTPLPPLPSPASSGASGESRAAASCSGVDCHESLIQRTACDRDGGIESGLHRTVRSHARCSRCVLLCGFSLAQLRRRLSSGAAAGMSRLKRKPGCTLAGTLAGWAANSAGRYGASGRLRDGDAGQASAGPGLPEACRGREEAACGCNRRGRHLSA